MMPTDRLVDSRRSSAPLFEASLQKCHGNGTTVQVLLKAHTARSLRLRIPTLPRSKPSGLTTGASPFLRPNPAILALDCARAGDEVPELAPSWRAFSYGHSRSFIGCKKSPALTGGASRSCLTLDVPL